MFSAIGRYFRAIGYLFTGKIDAARRAIATNPHVIQATYDRIVEEKTKRISQYKEAVAAMIAQQEKKKSQIRDLAEEIDKLERLKEGAAAKAKGVVESLKAKGVSAEAMREDAEYKRCLTAFNDFAATLKDKAARMDELEGEVESLDKSLSDHKIQLQALMREIEKLKDEAASTVADLLTAKEEESIADMLAGISDDRYSKELQDMRDMRDKAKAKARVSRELAGTDARSQEAEFLEYARTGASNDEFDRLIGLAAQAEGGSKSEAEPAREAASKAKLPEG